MMVLLPTIDDFYESKRDGNSVSTNPLIQNLGLVTGVKPLVSIYPVMVEVPTALEDLHSKAPFIGVSIAHFL